MPRLRKGIRVSGLQFIRDLAAWSECGETEIAVWLGKVLSDDGFDGPPPWEADCG